MAKKLNEHTKRVIGLVTYEANQVYYRNFVNSHRRELISDKRMGTGNHQSSTPVSAQGLTVEYAPEDIKAVIHQEGQDSPDLEPASGLSK